MPAQQWQTQPDAATLVVQRRARRGAANVEGRLTGVEWFEVQGVHSAPLRHGLARPRHTCGGDAGFARLARVALGAVAQLFGR